MKTGEISQGNPPEIMWSDSKARREFHVSFEGFGEVKKKWKFQKC